MLAAGAKVALGLRLVVEGSCPSGAAVQARLAPLLSTAMPLSRGTPPTADLGSATAGDVRASVEPLDDVLRVEVRDAEGRLLSLNDLPRSAACEGLAAAAAIVIATAVAAQPRGAPPVLSIPPRPPPPVVPPPTPRLTLSLRGSGLIALTTKSATAGAAIDLQLATVDDTWGGRLFLAGLGPRQLPIDSGLAEWSRLPAALLARRRLPGPSGRLAVDLSAGLWGAAVLVRGLGWAQNFTSLDVDIGVGGGLRLSHLFAVGRDHLALSFELLTVAWLRRQSLLLQDQAMATHALPAWDMLILLGLGWQRRLP